MKAIHHTTTKDNNLTYKVYALLEPDGKVYVGRTTSLRNRMASHAYQRKTSINSLAYRAIELNTELQARKIEAFLIEEFYDILTNKNFVNIGVRRADKCVKDFKTSIFFNSVMTYAQRMSNILKHSQKKNNRIGKLVAAHVPEWKNIEARGSAPKLGRPRKKENVFCGPAKPMTHLDYMTRLKARRHELIKP